MVGSSRLHTLGTSRLPTRSTSKPGRAGRCCSGWKSGRPGSGGACS